MSLYYLKGFLQRTKENNQALLSLLPYVKFLS